MLCCSAKGCGLCSCSSSFRGVMLTSFACGKVFYLVGFALVVLWDCLGLDCVLFCGLCF